MNFNISEFTGCKTVATPAAESSSAKDSFDAEYESELFEPYSLFDIDIGTFDADPATVLNVVSENSVGNEDIMEVDSITEAASAAKSVSIPAESDSSTMPLSETTINLGNLLGTPACVVNKKDLQTPSAVEKEIGDQELSVPAVDGNRKTAVPELDFSSDSEVSCNINGQKQNDVETDSEVSVDDDELASLFGEDDELASLFEEDDEEDDELASLFGEDGEEEDDDELASLFGESNDSQENLGDYTSPFTSVDFPPQNGDEGKTVQGQEESGSDLFAKDSDAEIVSVSNSQKSQASTTSSSVSNSNNHFSNNTGISTDISELSIDFTDLNKIGNETLFSQAEFDDIMKGCTEGSSGEDLGSLDQKLEDLANAFCFSPIASPSPAPVVSTGSAKKRSLDCVEEGSLEQPKTKKACAQVQTPKSVSPVKIHTPQCNASSFTLALPELIPSYQKDNTQSNASSFTLALPELNPTYQKDNTQSNASSSTLALPELTPTNQKKNTQQACCSHDHEHHTLSKETPPKGDSNWMVITEDCPDVELI
ncbi:unnamed protein product [Ambrosiozyma monospora]|uniref:Unnamed protein product n=1 Tax=Ambrosiozyma monospora TaxID=43982 RepID=A0A9W6YMA8_AMBMO|nr:unnamed protein product [Ambrosiozyma monospora]